MTHFSLKAGARLLALSAKRGTVSGFGRGLCGVMKAIISVRMTTHSTFRNEYTQNSLAVLLGLKDPVLEK